MPFLKPAVAEYLFREAEGFEVAVPMWPDGRLETLLMILQKTKHSGNRGSALQTQEASL